MMPVIAWNALHASTILRKSMSSLRPRCVDGIAADAARARELLDRSTATATALSPYIGYAATAEIAKESVEDRTPDSRARARARLAGREAAGRDPVGRGDDAGRRIVGDGKERAAAEWSTSCSAHRARRLVHAASLARMPASCLLTLPSRLERAGTCRVCFPASGSRAARSARSRRVAEARSDHGRAARSPTARSVARSRRRRRLVHDQLARRVGPNGVVYAEDIQPADGRSSSADACSARTCRKVRPVLGTPTDPTSAAGARRGADRRRATARWTTRRDPKDIVTLCANVARSLKPRAASASSTSSGRRRPGPDAGERVDSGGGDRDRERRPD